MSWGAAAWLMLGGSTVLLFLGLPVAFSFLVINLAGALLFLGGEAGLTQLARNSVVSVASFSLTPIPLFILMGEESGIGSRSSRGTASSPWRAFHSRRSRFSS